MKAPRFNARLGQELLRIFSEKGQKSEKTDRKNDPEKGACLFIM